MAGVIDEISLEDVQMTLSAWARQEKALKDHVRYLQAQIDELALLLRDGIEQVQNGFNLKVDPNVSLQRAVETAVFSVTVEAADLKRQAELQKDDIDRLRAQVVGFGVEQQESVDRLTEALELPPNKHRTIHNAVTDAVGMILEAKKMVRENL